MSLAEVHEPESASLKKQVHVCSQTLWKYSASVCAHWCPLLLVDPTAKA